MIATLLKQRISRLAACLAALALAFPTPPSPACGCGPVNVSRKCNQRTDARESTSCRKTCCRSITEEHGKSPCCRLHDNLRPGCCSPMPSGRAFAECNCGPSCACSRDQVPDLPAVPANQRSATGEQVAGAQTTLAAPLHRGQTDPGVSHAGRPHGCIDARATSLERCILLSCFTL